MRPRTRFPNNSNGNGNHPKHPGGRPPIYNPDKHPKAARLLIARHGLSHVELAEAFGVSDAAIAQWRNEHPEFLRSLNEGWYDWNNPKVKKSLAKQAVGYFLDEERVFCNANGDVTRVAVKRWYPPVPTATIFWLTNRCKDDWVHMNRIEHTGKDGKPIQTEDKITQTLLRELLSKTDPETLVGLKDTLENITCANTEPC